MEEEELATGTLEKGSIVKIGGIPFALCDEVVVESHPGNFKIAYEFDPRNAVKPTEQQED